MQKIKLSIFITIIALIFNACSSSDDSPNPGNTSGAVTANDFTTSLDENPTAGTVIGTVSASGSNLTYSLSNENVAGALAIDASTGELTVSDASAFDFETNPSITATYKVSNGTEEATASITITINDLADRAFIFTWTPIDGQFFGMPGQLVGVIGNTSGTTTGINYTIDWGDGTVEQITTSSASHVYPNSQVYTVKITGDVPNIAIGFPTPPGFPTASLMRDIQQWGDIKWQSMLFGDNPDLLISASDAPDLSNATSLQGLFQNCTNLAGNLNNWDVSTITNMGGLFLECRNFNQDLSNWDVSNVTNMFGMFDNARAFNQDLSSWTVSNVTNMRDMFANAIAFNGNVSNWTVDNVTNMSGMFFNASVFNQNISSWNVNNVTNMNGMFRFAFAFNQNISGWTVSNVVNCADFSTSSGFSMTNRPNFTNCTP